jgi:DNA-binding NarL/FixJ family response regulator
MSWVGGRFYGDLVRWQPGEGRFAALSAAGGAGRPVPVRRGLRVVIAGGNPIVRRGVRSVVEERLPARVVAEARSGSEALAAVARARPGVVILDVRTPPCDRLAVLAKLSRSCRVVVLSHSSDPHLVVQVLDSGAVAFLVHGEYSVAELVQALVEARPSAVHLSAPSAQAALRLVGGASPRLPAAESATREQLSQREAEVMDHIARGLSNSDVARMLGLSEKTVKNHINRIFAKLQVTTRAKAIVLWLGGCVVMTGERSDVAGAAVAAAGVSEGAALRAS